MKHEDQIDLSIVESLLPCHECSLYISHNDHKSYYETTKQWIDNDINNMYKWVSEDSKKRALETDSVWTLQWYPNTPVGFNAYAAATLGELLDISIQWNNKYCID